MSNESPYLLGLGLRQAALYAAWSGEAPIDILRSVRRVHPFLDSIVKSVEQHQSLELSMQSSDRWAENLTHVMSEIAQYAGLYESAWLKTSNLLLPTREPTDAARVRALLLDFGMTDEKTVSICLPTSPLPVLGSSSGPLAAQELDSRLPILPTLKELAESSDQQKELTELQAIAARI